MSNPEILTVAELTNAIKKHLEPQFNSIAVQGEISNLKEQSSGHFYFTLKDAQSQLSAVLFKGHARMLSRLPKSGDQVVLRGEISIYAPRGNYQMIVHSVEYQGVGTLLLKLHELKKTLQERGWFDAARKKPLPKFPKTIGVVTSPTGSVIQDILNVLGSRFSGFRLLLIPVKVQGDGAAQEIAQAIDQFNSLNLADVLIVGRGGGSLEDLWPFNEEVVAASIYGSKIPIISAVGHETDFSIADFVADVRAPTPSAAAAMAVQEKSSLLRKLEETQSRLRNHLQMLVRHKKEQIRGLSRQPLLANPYAILGPYVQKIDDLKEELSSSLLGHLQQCHLKLMGLQRQQQALSPALQIQAKRKQLTQLASHLQGINPKNLLTKGFCILFEEKSDSVIFSTRELSTEKKFRVQLQDGKINARVES